MTRKVAHRTAIEGAVAQALGVAICTAVLFLFVALTYSQITLPRYTAGYGEKDAQQVVNLVITVVATVIGILLSHCRRLTNEAETRSELRNGKLTIPRLHVHFEAAGGSKAAIGLPAIYNKEIWHLVILYLFAMVMVGFLHSVLSVIFVIEAVVSTQGIPTPVPIPLSPDPKLKDGVTFDPCGTLISSPGCTYELALTSLSSQLTTYTPYTIAGVEFQGPNGTQGLPYYAIKHFSDQVAASAFDEEYRRYCLPVMDPQVITCTEETFNQKLAQTDSNLVRFRKLNVSQTDYDDRRNRTGGYLVDLHQLMYKIILDYPNHDLSDIKYRLDDQGYGTMLVYNIDWSYTSIIAATDNGPSGYASMIYQMMYGADPDLAVVPKGESFYFVARCGFASMQTSLDYSSWREVDFSFQNGVLRANITDETCPSARGPGHSGFGDLPFALEGAGAVLASTDGYSKLFNLNNDIGRGTNIFQNMSRLDAVVNQIYHIIQTSWTQSGWQYSINDPIVQNNPIMMLDYPHLYVIRISWTPTTYIGLVLSILITFSAWALAARWARATYQFGLDQETWNLLRPVDLMGYSLAAYEDLIYDLNTEEHRKAAVRGKTSTALREHPVEEGTTSLIGLVSNIAMQRPGTQTTASSPITNPGGKFGNQSGARPGVTVTEKRESSSDGNAGDV